MSDSKKLENERNQQVKIQCIDYATRIIGKPVYVTETNGDVKKHQDDVTEVAKQIYKFVTSK